MYRNTRVIKFRYDVKKMGFYFIIPFLFLILSFAITSIKYEGVSLTFIKSTIAPLAFMLSGILVIGLFDGDFEGARKDLLYSINFNIFYFGIFRVLRLYVIYVSVLILEIKLLCKNLDKLTEYDYILPAVSVLFLFSLAYLLCVVIKNTYASIGVYISYCFLQYIMRGPIGGAVYPFHWCNLNPNYTDIKVSAALFISAAAIFSAIGLIFYRLRKERFSIYVRG